MIMLKALLVLTLIMLGACAKAAWVTRKTKDPGQKYLAQMKAFRWALAAFVTATIANVLTIVNVLD